MVVQRAEQKTALALALLLHAGFLLVVYLSAHWMPERTLEAAAGKPVMATLLVSSADVARAQQAIAAAQPEPQPEPAQKTPQPIPEPAPQTSDAPLQETPQEQLDKPDTVDQEEISRLAQEQAEQQALEEQERRQRQDQIDLTEDIARTQEAERRQRIREQYEAIRREREELSKRNRMEEQRIKQLADRAAMPEPRRGPTPAAANPGNNGVDNGLLSRYQAAIKATANANWNTSQVPNLVNCQVRFIQIRGGEVMRVDFLDCPFDPEAKESVERALMKTPMPFAGFESVFVREISINFCHPQEACER